MTGSARLLFFYFLPHPHPYIPKTPRLSPLFLHLYM